MGKLSRSYKRYVKSENKKPKNKDNIKPRKNMTLKYYKRTKREIVRLHGKKLVKALVIQMREGIR